MGHYVKTWRCCHIIQFTQFWQIKTKVKISTLTVPPQCFFEYLKLFEYSNIWELKHSIRILKSLFIQNKLTAINQSLLLIQIFLKLTYLHYGLELYNYVYLVLLVLGDTKMWLTK